MLVEHPFQLENSSGDILRGDLRHSNEPGTRPLLIVCPGFTAHKDWGLFPYVGRCLAESGFVTIVVNFSHNGVGETPFFSDYERFSRNTPGKELEDIQAVLNAASSGSIGEGVIDAGRIGMVGHSRGGGISILTAGDDQRIKAVVLWSTVATFLRFTAKQREEWETNGYFPLRFGSSRTMLRYDISVLRDMEKNRERYDLHKGIRRLAVPTLFVHGEADLVVRPEEGRGLYKESDMTLARFVSIRGASHTYGAVHPFNGTTPHIEELLELTSAWFHHHLL
jgi:dipeptidyl aminopeptidase/acylaminoacyl peptidase